MNTADTLIIHDAVPTTYLDTNLQFQLHLGNNLISYPFETSQNHEDALGDATDSIYALIGESVAAINTENGHLLQILSAVGLALLMVIGALPLMVKICQ